MAELINRQVLTIGVGKKLYVDMAVNLARSFLHWHPETDIRFQLVTDQPQLIPSDVRDKIQVIPIQAGSIGVGFSAKLHLDEIAADGQTLFIDSDCLIFGGLNFLFERFKGHAVSVAGKYVSGGEWFGDIATVCKKFNLPHIPQFNGGLYYLEKGIKAAEVYTTARELEEQYDEIGFIRLRNRPNDEVLMALSMQLHGQTPLTDDGTIMSDPQACRGTFKINVISGERLLVNPPPPNPAHQKWYPFNKVSPAIVHFLGSYTNDYPYLREVYRLNKAAAGKLNLFSEITALATIQYPQQFKAGLKNWLRPVFRKFFNARKIERSERIV